MIRPPRYPSPSIHENPQGSNVFPVFVSRPSRPARALSRRVSSLFRIISFESTIMGRRRHAGHVFAKVCAPNTKATWQTGSIPVGGWWKNVILRVSFWLAAWSYPSFLPSFLSPSFAPGGMLCFVDILGNGKEEEGWSILRDVKKRSLCFFFLPPPSGFFSSLTHLRCELVSESFDREFPGPSSISLSFLWRWRNSWCRVCPSLEWENWWVVKSNCVSDGNEWMFCWRGK